MGLSNGPHLVLHVTVPGGQRAEPLPGIFKHFLNQHQFRNLAFLKLDNAEEFLYPAGIGGGFFG